MMHYNQKFYIDYSNFIAKNKSIPGKVTSENAKLPHEYWSDGCLSHNPIM